MAGTTSFQGDGTDLLRSSVVESTMVDDGRPGKPGRKRPRASRKAPTTFFNTDTANFRAMVQQFTGFALEPPPPEMVNLQPIGGFHHQFGDQTQYAPLGGGVQVQSQDQAYLYQQNQQQQMFGLGNRIIESPLIISEYGQGGSNVNANVNDEYFMYD